MVDTALGGRTVCWMVTELIDALIPNVAHTLPAAAAGALVGALIPTWAARRTLTRPVAMVLEHESVLLAGVLSDLRRYPYVATIPAQDFAAKHHHNIWVALKELFEGLGTITEDTTEAECDAYAGQIGAHLERLHGLLVDKIGQSDQSSADVARYHELIAYGAEHGYGVDVDAVTKANADNDVVAAAQEVLACGNDRNLLAGKAPIGPAANPNSVDEANPPLIRALVDPPVSRRALSALAGASIGGLIPAAVPFMGLTGVSLWMGVAALVVLGFASIIISLVDIDTLYIDTPVWAATTAAGWALAAGAVTLYGSPERILYGALIVIGAVVMLEGANWAFKKFKGMDGAGFGDTLIIVATAGIPPVVLDDYTLGFWCAFLGFVAGAIGWLVARILGRVTRDTPFAFGPWLAAGWVLGMVYFIYQNTYLLGIV
jgi:hypothetical protein